MKITHVYPNSCEYAYPKYVNERTDCDLFDREIVINTALELRYLRGLRELGNDCSLLYLTCFRKPIKEFTHSDGYRIIRCPGTFWRGKLGYELSFPLLQQIKKERPDIVHFHGIYRNGRYPDMFDIAALYCKFNNVPFVGQYHTGQFAPNASRKMRLNDILKKTITLPKKLLKIAALRSSSGICSVNHQELERLFNPAYPEYYGVDLSSISHRLIPNTIDTSLFHFIPRKKALDSTGLDPNKRYILLVSRLFYEKGVHHLVGIMPKVLKEIPNAHLLIIGEFIKQGREYRNMIQGLIDKCGIRNAVRDC
jgi:glycosyltransferase involved in cell wall biosynthesis